MITCIECGRDITVGYSWRGMCVVCAEPHLEAAQLALAPEVSAALAKATDEIDTELEEDGWINLEDLPLGKGASHG